jgi:hypothetical protein
MKASSWMQHCSKHVIEFRKHGTSEMQDIFMAGLTQAMLNNRSSYVMWTTSLEEMPNL